MSTDKLPEPVAWVDPLWLTSGGSSEDMFLDKAPHPSCEWMPLYTAGQLRVALAAKYVEIERLTAERDSLKRLAQVRLAEAQAENARLREACASGWGEPTLVNALRAEVETLRAGFNAALWFMQDQGRLKLPRDYSPVTGEMFAAVDAARAAKGQG